MWGFIRAVPRSDHFIPSTLVICSDGFLDGRVLNDKKAPILHVAAARAAHTRLQNLPDQRLWHRVRLQSPHRASRLDNFEQIGGTRQLLDHGFLHTVTRLEPIARRLSWVVIASGYAAMICLWRDTNGSGQPRR